MDLKEKIVGDIKKAVNVFRCSSYFKKIEKKPLNEFGIYLESRKCTDFASNIFHVAKELAKPEYSSYKVFVGYKKPQYDFIVKKLKESGLNAELVKFESGEYYECLATCKYLFTDFHLSHRFVKREGQKVVSLWHGTPLKTLGKDCVTETQASVQRIFLIADYQVYPGTFMKEKMTDIYWLRNLYEGEQLCTGYPRNSAFYNEKKREEIRKELNIENKRAIIYMPTFRGIAGVNKNEEQNKILIEFFKEIDKMLTDNDIFYLKLHNYNDAAIDCSEFKHITKTPDNYDNYDFQNACDILVTDYSSVFFDFAVSGRKIILFQYDLDEYIRERGLCIDLKELPFPKVYTPKELVDEINRPKNYEDKEFLSKFANYDNVNAPSLLCKKVLFNEDPAGYSVEKVEHNGKKNVVIYCGPLKTEEEVTEFWSMIKKLDTDNVNYYVSYFEPEMYSHAERLAPIPENINLLGMWGRISFSFKEMIAYFLIKDSVNNKILNKHHKREMIKHFGLNIKLDCFVMWYTQDRAVRGLYANADGEKIATAPINGFVCVEKNKLSDYLNDKFK